MIKKAIKIIIMSLMILTMIVPVRAESIVAERSMSGNNGEAYAVLTENGDLIFLRSEGSYASGSTGTISDIDGREYEGTIFGNVELGAHGWTSDNYKYSVRRAYVAEGERIYPSATSQWFYGCYNITDLDLSGIETSNVTDMSYMFSNCHFRSLDLSSFDTSNVTNMSSMFSDCYYLVEIDISSFDTRNVYSMSNMFSGCNSLQNLDLSSFDTSRVQNMSGMFSGCSSLTSLDLSSFDTNNVTNMGGMFSGCHSLQSLDLSSFETGNVTNMSSMFSGCNSLQGLDISSFDTSRVQRMYCMFSQCKSLHSLDLSGFDTRSVYEMTGMFSGCDGLEELDISSFDTRSVNNMSNMFYETYGLKRIKLGTYFTTWRDNAYLVSGNWSNGEIVKTEVELYNEYPNNARTWNGWWEREVTESPDPGKGYAVLTENGDLIFLRSEGSYASGSTGTISDIDGREYEGTIFGNVELGAHGWTSDNYKYSVRRAYVAEGERIYPSATSQWFYGCYNITDLDLSGIETSNVTDMSYMFSNCHFRSLDLSSFDTSNVTNMSSMFSDCYYLVEIDISSFDTRNVYSMSNMFSGCNSLQNLDLSSFDTSRVQNMSGMFSGCSSLTSLDLSSFDTNNVTNMGGMFSGCHSLQSLDLSSFETGNVTNMSSMFSGCNSLQGLDISSFDTSRVQRMYCMFSQCKSLHSLDLSGFDTRSVYEMTGMFSGCDGLEELDISSFDTRSVNNMSNMFYETYGLKRIKLGTYFTTWRDNAYLVSGNWSNGEIVKTEVELYNEYPNNARTWNGWWEREVTESPDPGKGYAVLTENGDLIFLRSEGSYASGSTGTISDIDGREYEGTIFGNVELGAHGWTSDNYKYSVRRAYVAEGERIYPSATSQWFYGCYNITDLDLSGIETSNVTDMSYMFSNCHFRSLDLSSFDTSNVTNMSSMFSDCYYLVEIDISSFDTRNVYSMSNMFSGCNSLQNLDLSSFDTSRVQNMSGMFSGCSSLTSLDLSSFDTNNVTNMGGMFSGCHSLQSLDLSSFETGNVTNMSSMFSGCNSLQGLDISSFDTSRVQRMYCMFSQCKSLHSLDLSGFDTRSVYEMTGMFSGCDGLEELDISSFDTRSVNNMSNMFYETYGLKRIKLGTYFTTWRDNAYLVSGNWSNGEIVKTEVELYNEYPNNARTWNGWWYRRGTVTILTQPESETIRAGELTDFTIEAIGNGLSYQWQYKVPNKETWRDFSSGNNTTLRKRMQAGWDGWKIRCVVTDDSGTVVTSDEVTLSLLTGPVMISQPEDAEGLPGEYITFKVEAEGPGLTYQWQYKTPTSSTWKNFSSGNNATLRKKLQESWDNWKVRCVISASDGYSTTSEEAGISIVRGPQITRQPESVREREGKIFNIAVEAAGEGLSYQWQYKTPTSSTWKNFSNGTNAILSKRMQGSWDGWRVRCVVSNERGASSISEEAELTIKRGTEIIRQPESVSGKAGEYGIFTVEAEGDSTLSYQWQYKVPNKEEWKNFSNGSNATLRKRLQESWDNWRVRCVITDADGNTIISEEANIDIEYDGIEIIRQPESVETEADKYHTFVIEATGEGLSYQWQYKVPNKDEWKNYSNGTGATMRKKVLASWDGWRVRCVITDANGNSLTSEEVNVTIKK